MHVKRSDFILALIVALVMGLAGSCLIAYIVDYVMGVK